MAKSLAVRYFDLEQAADQTRLDAQWADVMATPGLVALDEAQAWPVVFNRLRGSIDADRSRVGRFLILGSVTPALMKEVSESLAGRIALIELCPFLAVELPETEFGWRELGRFCHRTDHRHTPSQGNPPKPHYLRTSDGYEIDLILEIRGRLWAIEVKLTTDPAPQDLHRLEKAAELIDADQRILISQVPHSAMGQRSSSCNLVDFLTRLMAEA